MGSGRRSVIAAGFVALRSGLKAQVHAVLAKQGVRVPMSDLFGAGGQRFLDEFQLDAPYSAGIGSLRRLIDAFTFEIDVVTKRNGAQLKTHPGFQAVQAIRGVGPVLAAIFVAEIGDVSRFSRPEQLCSWAGMTPQHRESDTKVHRGRITKQGNPLVRWAAVEAVQTMENTATHNNTLVPGDRILRHSGSASRPSPLRGSTSGRALTPTPRWRMSAPSRGKRRNRPQPVQPQGLTRPRSFRDDLHG